jgi:Fungal Zn(2)-Cys(6) binuclear cluster domain
MAEDRETNAESRSEAKRRKIRKGTRSCWECKRRKLKCLFENGLPTDSICTGCRRRGTKCVSQELPEEVSAPVDKARQLRERVVRVEAQLEQLIKKGGNDGPTSEGGGVPAPGIPTPTSMESESSRLLHPHKSSEVRVRDLRVKAWYGVRVAQVFY